LTSLQLEQKIEGPNLPRKGERDMKREKSTDSNVSPLKSKLLKEQLDVPLAGASFVKSTWTWRA
jgi:hypothetical protein